MKWSISRVLGLDADEAAITYGYVASWGLSVAVALLSIVVAVALPDRITPWLAGAPGMAYFLLAFSGFFAKACTQRARHRFAVDGA